MLWSRVETNHPRVESRLLWMWSKVEYDIGQWSEVEQGGERWRMM